MIFVDTSAWYALIDTRDQQHQRAIEWHRENTEQLLTTDYVIDETLTLLTRRGGKAEAIALGESLFGGGLAELFFLDHRDVADTWEVFRHSEDKAWSFTDCSSYVVMRRLGITTAFAFDDHFGQFGTITVVP